MTGAIGPFGEAALMLSQFGLAVIPCAGEGGKVPQVRWSQWKCPPGRAFLTKLLRHHAEENIGVVCGLSNLTIVDVDDARQVEAMLSRCGPTSLVTETPSGGFHLWYRSSGEQSCSLRGRDGLAVDVKAAGGIVVAPPSIRPDGEHAGKQYRIVEGSWNELKRLPTPRPGSLPLTDDEFRQPSMGQPSRRASEGSRNNTLFGLLLRHARGCDTIDALRDVAQGLNDEFTPPLPAAEVERIVASVWRYETSGKNWSGKEPHIIITHGDLERLVRNPDALALFGSIKVWHGARKEPFALSPDAMRSSDKIPGWSKRRYIDSRRWLIDAGFLYVVHSGGAGPRDPSLFTWKNPTLEPEAGKLKKGGKECSVILGADSAPLASGGSS